MHPITLCKNSSASITSVFTVSATVFIRLPAVKHSIRPVKKFDKIKWCFVVCRKSMSDFVRLIITFKIFSFLPSISPQYDYLYKKFNEIRYYM